MARVFQCDVCKAIGKPDEYGLPPSGWTQAQVQLNDVTGHPDFCSPKCAATFFTRMGKARG